MRAAIFIALGVTVVGAIAAVVFLAAPGGNSLAEAAENMRDQNVRMRIEMGTSQDGEDLAIAGTMLSTADGGRVKMDVTTTSADDEFDMTIVMIRDDTWVATKNWDGLLPEGKRWVHEVDRSGAPTTMTMAEFADFLSHADEVEHTGDAIIDGKTVEHYQGHVNAREAAEETGGEAAKRFEQALGDRDVFLPIEAWIGEDGLPVRVSLQAEGTDGSMSITAKILEYGVPVDVQPPPKAETIEVEEFDELTGG